MSVTNGGTARLTVRERRVLQLVAAGASRKQIASALALSEHTVREYERRALRKLGVRTRVEAACIVARGGGGAALRSRALTPTSTRLTERQRTVLDLVCRGRRNTEIAAMLRISPWRVAEIIRELRVRTGAANRVSLAVWYALSCVPGW